MIRHRTILTSLLVVSSACTPEDGRWYLPDGGWLEADAHTNVMRRFEIATEEDGVAPGFDLDARESEQGDDLSCGHGDLISLDGKPGVDNQLAKIWTTVYPVIGPAVEALLQGSINEGRFLMIVELTGVDDLFQDDDVTLKLFTGRGDPQMGSFDLIAPDQTFYEDNTRATSIVEHVQIIDGHITAGPLDFEVPVNVLELDFSLPIRSGMIELDIDEYGAFSGQLGGAVSVSGFLDHLTMGNGGREAAMVRPVFEANADMGKTDGECDLFSTAFLFESTTAFVVRYDDDGQPADAVEPASTSSRVATALDLATGLHPDTHHRP
jgi:hypothetical protein